MNKGNEIGRVTARSTLALLVGIFVLVYGIAPISEGKASQSSQDAGQSAPNQDPKTAPAPTAPPTESPFKHRAPTPEELDKLLKEGYATRVKVDRVIVPAVVLDRKGRPVEGLKPSDFLLSEDQVLQKIDYFQVDQRDAISMAFLVDVSGSMRLSDKIGEAKEAVRYFLEGLGPADQAAVLTFADGAVDTLAPFGSSPALILARLNGVKAYGQTALHDALAAAPGVVDEEHAGRKAVVLITDGIDNFSRKSLFDAMTAARRVDVPIYTIGFAGLAEHLLGAPESEAGTNAEVLKMIADETGGRFFMIDDPDEMKEAIRTIEEDLRSQYVIGYTPPSTRCDGSFRKIELKVGKNSYRVRTRKGYFSGPC